MRFLHDIRHALGFGLRRAGAIAFEFVMMLMHLFLVFMKIEFVHARAGADFERFDVPCLISHDASISCATNLSLSDCLTLKRARSYSQDSSRAGLAQLVERAIRNRKVIGSTPIAGSRLFPLFSIQV